MGTNGNDLTFIIWKPVFLGVGNPEDEYPDAPRLPVVQSCNDWDREHIWFCVALRG